MLRERLDTDLKTAMKAREPRALSTIRLILTAIRDRDIAARGKGNADGISDQEIFQVLQTMVRQRREAIELYEQGGRLELAEQEADEIKIIEGFQPQQLGESEIGDIIGGIIEEVGAGSIKDMGRVMGVLRERYAGQMDFSKASAALKQQLGAL
ncbi:MAG: GatB/YqeY domain-containing protein [Rhodospirillales bacterium]|nr:GatB/YqeY domain-containing protein [Rhodospirillales bacterium]